MDRHLVILIILSFAGIALSAVCSNSYFGGCDKSRGLCWEVQNPGAAGTTFCTCKAGYTFVFPSTRKGQCRDIDECKSGAHSCDIVRGKCVNTIGSHHCVCNPGYVLDFTKTKCLLQSKISGQCGYLYRGKRDADIRQLPKPAPYRYGPGSGSQRDVAISHKSDEMKDILLNYFLRANEDREKAIFTFNPLPRCGCEAGFRRCSSGLCQDINECRERTSKCDIIHGACHNSHGGYFCSCREGYQLGPCGYKCYKPGQRPAKCTSENLMARALVRTDSNGLNDEASRALVTDVETEKAYIFGRTIRAIRTLQGTPCRGTGSTIQPLDVNHNGKIDVVITSTCVNGRYEVRTTYNQESRWQPWTCWTECKATCHGGIQTRTRYCEFGLVGDGACRGPATEYKTCYSGKKCALRVRKDSSTLTKAEKDDLVQAFQKFKDDTSTNGFWAAAGTHVFPNQCIDHSTGNPGPCCYHGARLNFAIWHRAELLNIEEGLIRHLKSKTLGLPYWNWLKDNKAPDFVWSKTYNGKPNPFANVIIRYDLTPHQAVQRDTTTDFNFIKLARDIYLTTTIRLMKAHSLFRFSEELENAHNWIHSSACPHETSACTFSMGQLEYAAYDPLFFMHHTNVDRQIARMQQEMTKNGETAWTRQSALEPQESIYHFNEPYNPFRNKTLTAFKKLNALSSMQDLFYHKELLGYKYDTLVMHGAPALTTKSDVVNIMQYERSIQTNVKIAFYVEDTISGLPALPACSQLAETNKRFVGTVLIMGSKTERPWISRQPVVVPMSQWLTQNAGQVATTDYKIRACYTHDRTCTKNCPGISSTVKALIPSPQLVLYPKHTREDLLKFEWDVNTRMPSWTVNVRSAYQWIYLWGKESRNIVQVTNKAQFTACNTAGGHRVTCTGSCVLPTGYHYFIHRNVALCKKGLKLSVLSTL